MQAAVERYRASFPPAVYHRIVTIALTVHGMISMELSDRFSDMAGDPESFYRFQVVRMLREIGIVVHSAS